jgi:hypothetical protein
MADKQNSKDTPYHGERSTEPHTETGNIDFRNNNVEMSTPGPDSVNVEGANDSGIGDSAVNDRKMTNYTSNHSADA